MLKLTLYEDENRIIYIRADRIISMVRGLPDNGTFVKLDHTEHWVCEKPEQILAMEEMVKAVNPLMMVGSDSPDHTRGYTSYPSYISRAR